MCSHHTNLLINVLELPIPMGVVQEGPQVKPVVFRRIVFSVVGRSEDSALVAVLGVATEEMFYLLSNLQG